MTAARADQAAQVSWTKADANGAPVTGYTITSSPGGQHITVDGDTTTARVPGLTNGTAYTFTVTATNAVGDSPEAYADRVLEALDSPSLHES